jgi:hypothetical protein
MAAWALLEALPSHWVLDGRSFVVLFLVDMASSSPSLTPPALTPDYTGSASPDSQNHAEAAVKNLKARRSTAFYPNMNSANKPVKPFSRSAAKRQSVMTLGSIEHLQHYFTKTGIVAKPKCVFISLSSTFCSYYMKPIEEVQRSTRASSRWNVCSQIR